MEAASKLTSLDLYRMANELCTVLEQNEGITDDDIDAAIDEFLIGSEDKLDRHRYAIDRFKRSAEMYRAEAKRLQERARMHIDIVDRVKRHARLCLEARVELMGEKEGRSMENAHGLVYLQRYTRLEVDDAPALLDHLGTDSELVKVSHALRRDALTRAMKAGKEPAGVGKLARLVEHNTVIFK